MGQGLQSNGHTDFNPMTVKLSSTMKAGSSGGPWVFGNEFVNSLVSYGDPRFPRDIYGPFFDNITRILYNNATNN